jgi:hypothetical protein
MARCTKQRSPQYPQAAEPSSHPPEQECDSPNPAEVPTVESGLGCAGHQSPKPKWQKSADLPACALATFFTGLICALLLRRGAGRSTRVRLFLIWMTYSGFFMSLPQAVLGAVNPQNDVGMAMQYLHLNTMLKSVAALAALGAIPVIALSLGRTVLSLAEDPSRIANIRARTRFVFEVATLPAVIAILLIIPFRVPRGIVEVVAVPVVVTGIGIAWLQAGAREFASINFSERSSLYREDQAVRESLISASFTLAHCDSGSALINSERSQLGMYACRNQGNPTSRDNDCERLAAGSRARPMRTVVLQ